MRFILFTDNEYTPSQSSSEGKHSFHVCVSYKDIRYSNLVKLNHFKEEEIRFYKNLLYYKNTFISHR